MRISGSVAWDAVSASEVSTAVELDATLIGCVVLRGRAQSTGWMTVRMNPVHSTPEGSFKLETRMGIISAQRCLVCRTNFQEPLVASKDVSPN